jgi:hypothetical protein
MHRIDRGHGLRHPEDALDQLRRAGWSTCDVVFPGGAGGIVWLVSATSGENTVRAEGAARGEAWGRAVERARGLGMLGR